MNMNINRIRKTLKIIIVLCAIAIGVSIVSFEFDCLMYLVKKNNLVQIEATIENIEYQKRVRGGRYETKIDYFYEGEAFSQNIDTDIRDINEMNIYVYIDKENPEKVYRGQILLPAHSTDTIFMFLFILVEGLAIGWLHIIKKNEVEDYKIPNV